MRRSRAFASIVVMLVIGLNAAITQAAQQTTAQRLATVRADLFGRGERVKDDIQELKGILAVEPDSAEAHLLLGIAYRTLGIADVMSEAVAEMRQAVALDNTFVAARFYLAHMYLDLGRAERAREELDAALAQKPDTPQFLALLGEVERRLKNPARTVELTRRALAIDPAFVQARYYLGLALFALNRRDEAVKELEQVVSSGARVADAYLALGTAYIETNRPADAVKTLTAGTQIDPSRGELQLQLARAYRLQGDLTQADAALARAKPRAVTGQTSLLAEQRQLEVDFRVEEGQLRAQQGRLPAAAEAFRQALALDPAHGPTARDLASVYLRQGLYTRASQQAARATELGFPLPPADRQLLQQKLREQKAPKP